MRLTVVGCSGSYPGPEAPASCYLLEHEHAGRTWRVLLDLGSGALGALHRYADPLSVDAVLLSHLHADHCLDLCGYYVLRKYHPDGPQPRLPVEAYGLRVSAGGRLLAYTGDTGRCDQLEAVARGADLLLAEASFHDGEANPPGIHLTGGDCGRLAHGAGVGRLLVTHVPPWYDALDMLAAARATWGGPTDLAVAGGRHEI